MTTKKVLTRLSILDKVLEVLAVLVVLSEAVFVALNYTDLPKEFPVHFDEEGVPNAFGTPLRVVMYPLISLGVYLLLTVLARFPHKFYYPIEVTAQNRERVYSMALRAIRVIKLLVVIMYAYIAYNQVVMLKTGVALDRQVLYFIAIVIVMIPPLVITRMISRKGRY